MGHCGRRDQTEESYELAPVERVCELVGRSSRVGVYNRLVERPELVRTRRPRIHLVIEDVHEVIAQERRERAARTAGR